MSVYATPYTHNFSHRTDAMPLSVVWDAGIYNRDFAEGQPLPLLIIDTSSRPDVRRFIDLHAEIKSGEVRFRWVQVDKRSDYWSLLVEALKPIQCDFIVNFHIERQGILVETILHSKAAFLQAGQQGDNFLQTTNKLKMLLELPDVGVKPSWDKVFYDVLFKNGRSQGLKRKDANQRARAKIAFARSIALSRFKALKGENEIR